MAASDATAKDKEDAKRRMDDGTKPVEVDKRPYRPKLDSKYVEPEYFPEEETRPDTRYTWEESKKAPEVSPLLM